MNSKILILLLFFIGYDAWNVYAQENTTNPKVVCELYRNFDLFQKNWQIRDSIVFTYTQNGYRKALQHLQILLHLRFKPNSPTIQKIKSSMNPTTNGMIVLKIGT